jgi:hypothetical protein
MPINQLTTSRHTQRLKPYQIVQKKRDFDSSKIGEFLRPDNRIHTLFDLQSKLYKPGTIRHAYDRLRLTMEGLSSIATQGSLKRASAPRQLQSMYYILTGRSAMIPNPYQTLTESLLKNEHDCDTAGMVLMAMGDEMGARTGLVVLPGHVVLAIEDQLSKTTLYLDKGQLLTSLDMTQKYNLSVNDLTRSTLNGSQVNAYFENNTAINLALKGNVDESETMFQSSVQKASTVDIFSQNLAVSKTSGGDFVGAAGRRSSSYSFSLAKQLISDAYPMIVVDKGVDLDRDGIIEEFNDFNHNGEIGDAEDFILFSEKNKGIMSEEIPFISWGKNLSVSNPLHSLIALYRKAYSPSILKIAYEKIDVLVGKMKQKVLELGHLNSSDQEKLKAAYSVLDPMINWDQPYSEGGTSFIDALMAESGLDCDTHVYLLHTLAHEIGIKSGFIVLPTHTILIVEDSLDGHLFPLDFGESRSKAYYVSEFNLSKGTLSQVFKPLWGKTVQASFLAGAGIYHANDGRQSSSLRMLKRATELAPHIGAFWDNYGSVLKHNNMDAEANVALINASNLYPDDSDLLFKLSKSQLDQGDLLSSFLNFVNYLNK